MACLYGENHPTFQAVSCKVRWNLRVLICTISPHLLPLSSHLPGHYFMIITVVIGAWRQQRSGFQLFLTWHVRKADDLISPSSFSSHLPAFIWENFIPPRLDPTSLAVGSHLTGLGRLPYKRKKKITKASVEGWNLSSQLTAWKMGWFFHKNRP